MPILGPPVLPTPKPANAIVRNEEAVANRNDPSAGAAQASPAVDDEIFEERAAVRSELHAGLSLNDVQMQEVIPAPRD